MKNPYATWIDLTFDSWRLASESQAVIGLRMMQLATGTATATEVGLMVSEKIQAAAEVQAQMLTSALTGATHLAPRRAVAHYRRKVRANRRRLSR